MGFIPDYKDIADLLKKGLTLEAQEKIMELRVAALELQEENLKLRERVKQLECKLAISRNLVFEANAGLYWTQKPDGSREGPYCAVCYDEHGRLARLHDGRQRAAGTRWLCMVCNNVFL
jgi:hypothetical protein